MLRPAFCFYLDIMKFWLLAAVAALIGMACATRDSRDATEAPHAGPGFVDKVWTVVESPGGPGGIYVFLSDGTFIRTAKGAGPEIGKWSWDGEQLTIGESALPYQADIDSLSDSFLGLNVRVMSQSYRLRLVTAIPSMPDTTREVVFNPASASIIANGNNPTWLCHIDNERASLRMGRMTLEFTDGQWVQDCASVWDYTARMDFGGREETLNLQLSTASCVDGSNGVETPLTAVLMRGDAVLYGCAVAGKLRSSR
jgi:uncharacterized membrane protein